MKGRTMFGFRPLVAPPPPATWAGPGAFEDWVEADIDRVSAAIRWFGQPDREGFRRFARVALNTMRGGSAVELVARAIEVSANPGSNPDDPIVGGHYMAGMPRWCMWVEYARPAVAEIMKGERQDLVVRDKNPDGTAS